MESKEFRALIERFGGPNLLAHGGNFMVKARSFEEVNGANKFAEH